MAYEKELEKARAKYDELLDKSKGGDKQAFKDKAHAMNEVRQIERARANADANGAGRSKRSMQEAYVEGFDNEQPVVLKEGEKPTTLREHHAKRLLKK